MSYPHTWLNQDDLPQSSAPAFADAVSTYISETNKTANAWSRLPDTMLSFSPHAKSNTVREILAHQLLSERRFFAEFIGLEEPAPATLLPPGHEDQSAPTEAYIQQYIKLAKARLDALATADEAWWLAPTSFFDVTRTRNWVLWRRILHTAHHRTQLLTYLRLAGELVPATYGPSGDETWDGADPTLSVESAG